MDKSAETALPAIPCHSDTKPWEGKVMISFVRTASIAPGKAAGALAFGHQVVKLFQDKFGITLQMGMPIGGNPNRLGWRATYANLAEFEAATNKFLADAEYMELLAKAADLFIAGSVHDEIWRSL